MVKNRKGEAKRRDKKRELDAAHGLRHIRAAACSAVPPETPCEVQLD